MTVLVKICGMTDEAAVRAAVDAGADAVGFVFFEKSPRNLSPDEAVRLAAAIPAGVTKVAVMLHPDRALWNEVQRLLQPDVLQTDSEDFSYLNVDPGIEKWPVLREGSVPAVAALPARFVYEGRMSGHGEKVDWDVAAELSTHRRMILAGGLDTDNVGEAIRKVRPWGVDVSSAVESQPGVKDPGLVKAFIEAARAAEKREGNAL